MNKKIIYHPKQPLKRNWIGPIDKSVEFHSANGLMKL